MAAEVAATRYAKALLETIKGDQKLLDQVACDLGELVRVIRENEELKKVLFHPSVSYNRKSEIVKRTFEKLISPVLMKFLLLLIRKKRMELLDEIAGEFRKELDIFRGVHEAEIRTGISISNELLARMKSVLEKITGYTLKMKPVLDPEILGGVRVRIDDIVIDGSLTQRLRLLEECLLRKGLLETE